MKRCHACSGPSEAFHSDRRIVTVLFADLSGFTSMCEQRDPEHVTDMLNQCFQLLSRSVYAYGGMIDKYMGDALMAVFGAPKAHEDDPERALAAALDMLAAAREFARLTAETHGVELKVRIGLNTGLVVAGAVGDDIKRTYTVIGDAVNLAQRMEAAAEPDHIMVGPETYRQACHAFRFRALAPLTVKGKSLPVKAFELLGRKADDRPTGLLGRLIGREAELSLLASTWENAKRAKAQWVTLRGDAGIGKTHLSQAFLRHANPERTLSVRCVSYQQSQPLMIVRDCLLVCMGLAPTASPAAIQQGLEALPQGNRADRERLRMLLGLQDGDGTASAMSSALRQALEAASHAVLSLLGDRPTVLIFEDLQWADEASRSWLQTLAQDMEKKSPPLLVLALTRHLTPELRASSLHTRVELAVLTRSMGYQLIKSLSLHRPLSFSDRKRILEFADGNPMVIRELVRACHESPGTSAEVATTLKALVAARLDRLVPEQRHTLEAAAVAGRHFDAQLLHALTDVLDPDVHLQALCEQDLLRPNDPHGFSFTQAIVHEVTYQSLLHRARRRLHLRMAEALISRHGQEARWASTIASHLLEADAPPRAFDYLLNASEHARRSLAFTEAKQHLQRALQLATEHLQLPPLELGNLWRNLAEIESSLGEHAEAMRSLDSALGLTNESSLRCDLLRLRVQLLERQGHYQDALTTLEEASLEPAAMTSHRASLLLIDRGWILWRLGDAVAAEGACRDALMRLREEAHPAECARAFSILGILAYRQNAWEDASKLHAQALALRVSCHDTLGMASSLNNLGMVASDAGQWAEAKRWYLLSLEHYLRARARSHAASVYNNLGDLYARQGVLAKAKRRHQAALALRERLGDRFGMAASHCALGETLRRAGDWLEARHHLHVGLKGLESTGETELLAEACHSLGQLEFEAGSSHAAVKWLKRSLKEALRAKDFLRVGAVYRTQAQIALAAGQLQRARFKLEACQYQYCGRDTPYELAQTLQVEAELLRREGRLARAEACAERARKLLAHAGIRQAGAVRAVSSFSARTL